MRTRRIRRSLAGSMLLLVAVASPASPQLRNLTATGYTGLAVPFGQFADYATVGASAGLQLEVPISDPLAVMLNAELDMPQSDLPGVPDFRLWRYQAGLAANLLGDPAERWGIRGLLGAGATSFRTSGFFPGQGNVEDRLDVLRGDRDDLLLAAVEQHKRTHAPTLLEGVYARLRGLCRSYGAQVRRS